MKKIIVRVLGSHPTGIRRRCGFMFGHKPSYIEVTKEELKIIEEDKYLLIVTKGLALEEGKKNPQKRKNKKTNKSENKKTNVEPLKSDKKEENEGNKSMNGGISLEDEGDSSKENEEFDTFEKLITLKRKGLVKLAQEKGFVINEQFNEGAAKKDIANLILS